MTYLLLFLDVLRDDFLSGVALGGFHIPHQLLILFGAEALAADNGRQGIGEEEL
jgi:hypothetical protein